MTQNHQSSPLNHHMTKPNTAPIIAPAVRPRIRSPRDGGWYFGGM